MIVGGPDSPGPAPKSAKIVKIIIVAIMASMFLFGLLLKGASMPVLIGAGFFIVLFTALAIVSTQQASVHSYSGRQRIASSNPHPVMDPIHMYPTSMEHSTHTPTETNWTPESSPGFDPTPSYDSSPSFDSSSSFDIGSSSCGSSSND
jgi:hypothetical protein